MQVEISTPHHEDCALTAQTPDADSVKDVAATGQKATDPCGRLIVDPSTLPSLLTAAEVASILRLRSEKAVYAIAASGTLPGVIRVGRRFRVRRDELLRHLDGKKRG